MSPNAKGQAPGHVPDSFAEPFRRLRSSRRRAGREIVPPAPDRRGGELSAPTFAELTDALRSSTAELAFSQAEMVTRLRRMVERRGDETGAHLYRVSRFSARLASLAGLDAARCELIRLSSALHDVGKAAAQVRSVAPGGAARRSAVGLSSAHLRSSAPRESS